MALVTVGTADDWVSALQNASNGDTIELLPGNYLCENIVLENLQNVVIRSQEKRGATINGNSSVLALKLLNCFGITFEDFTVTNPQREGIDGRLVYQAAANDYTSDGLVLENSSNIIIRGNSFYNIATRGVTSVSSTSVTGIQIRQNLFSHIGHDTAGADVSFAGGHSHLIEYNLFGGSVDGLVIAGRPIAENDECHSHTVRNNIYLPYRWEDAIDFKGVNIAGTGGDSVVKHNAIYAQSNGFSSITVQNASQGVRILRNQIDGGYIDVHGRNHDGEGTKVANVLMAENLLSSIDRALNVHESQGQEVPIENIELRDNDLFNVANEVINSTTYAVSTSGNQNIVSLPSNVSRFERGALLALRDLFSSDEIAASIDNSRAALNGFSLILDDSIRDSQMAVDAQQINKDLYNHGGNVWRTNPPPTGGSGQFQLIIPPMPGPAKQVYGGIPFAQGELLNTINARVLRDSVEIPASYQVLCRWPDNSIKSLGVGVVTDTDANAETELTLVYDGNSQQVYSGLTVTESASEWTIDTGVGVFTIHKTAFNFLTYAVGGNTVISGGDIEAVSAVDNNTYRLSLDTGFTLTKHFEDSQKVEFDLVGHLTFNGADVGKIWIQYKFYYNCDYVDLEIQYVDDKDEESSRGAAPNPLNISFSDYRILVNHSLTNFALSTGSQDEHWTTSTSSVSGPITGVHRIDQEGYLNIAPSHGATQFAPLNPISFSGEESGEAASGWLACHDSSRYFYLMQRYFWQQFPGRLEVTATTASIYFHSVFEQTPDLVKPADDTLYRRPNTMYANTKGTSKSYQVRLGGRNQPINLTEVAELKVSFDVYHLHLSAEIQQVINSSIMTDFVGANANNSSLTDVQMDTYVDGIYDLFWSGDLPYFDFVIGERDFGNQLFSTTGVPWTNGEHLGKYSLIQYWLLNKSRATSFLMTSRMLWERDKKVYRTRRKGYWSSRVTEGDVSGSQEYYYPAGEPNGVSHSNIDHDSGGCYITHLSIGFLWLNYLLTGDRIALEALTTAKGWLDEITFTFYNQEYYPGNNNLGHGAPDQDRSWGGAPACLLEIYQATNDATMFDPDSALVNWATYMRRWALREANQYGGFNEEDTYYFDNTPQVDPRTASAVCDYNSGTITWLMYRGGQANVGSSEAGYSNGNSMWMLANVIISMVKFIDYDTELNNRSGLNLDVLKEILFQVVRHNCIWGWNASGYFEYSNQNRTYDGAAEGYIAYSLARVYEFWHEKQQSGNLIHPESYYDQMSFLKDTVLDAYWNRLTANPYDPPLASGPYRFGFWGNTDTGFLYEAIEALDRVRALT